MSFSRIFLEVDVNWLFVIIKSYVRVNFKERNNDTSSSVSIVKFEQVDVSWLHHDEDYGRS